MLAKVTETSQARQAQRNTANLRAQLNTTLPPSPVTYPPNNGLARDLRGLAQLLKAGLPIRACSLQANGGFDTHSGQIGSFGNDLESNCLAIQAFQAHLEAEGLADRVMTFVWSEFGRRPEVRRVALRLAGLAERRVGGRRVAEVVEAGADHRGRDTGVVDAGAREVVPARRVRGGRSEERRVGK